MTVNNHVGDNYRLSLRILKLKGQRHRGLCYHVGGFVGNIKLDNEINVPRSEYLAEG